MISIVFSTPGHHFEMMLPVARALLQRGERVQMLCLAELRGLTSPPAPPDVVVRRVLPPIRKRPTQDAGIGAPGTSARTLVRAALWHVLIHPRLRWLLRGSSAVIIPNDAAFPYDEIARMLRHLRIPFALLQEGVRLVYPRETSNADMPYGAGGADRVCVWGEASAEHFRRIAPAARVCVTGNPRFDELSRETWVADGQRLLAKLGLDRAPLLFMSSAVDDIGFCTTEQKLALFARFMRAAAPIMKRENCGVLVKLHPREDPDGFRVVLAELAIPNVHLVVDQSVFAVLAAGRAAVISLSTVGLEALMFGLPLAVLPLPGHGHVFEYVSSGVAIGLDDNDLAPGIDQLLTAPISSQAQAFIQRHLADRGRAADNVADQVFAIARRASR